MDRKLRTQIRIGEDDYILLMKRVGERQWTLCDLEEYRKLPLSMIDLQVENEEDNENNQRKCKEQTEAVEEESEQTPQNHESLVKIHSGRARSNME